MNLCPGPHFPGYGKHSRIRDNQGIAGLRLHVPQLPKIFRRPLKVVIVGKNIRRDINLHAVGMGKSNPFRHLLSGKIFRLCPQSESFSSDVDRIRTKKHRCFQHFQTSCRNQQLRLPSVTQSRSPSPPLLRKLFYAFSILTLSVTPSPTGSTAVSSWG